jgi:hypothetical protein
VAAGHEGRPETLHVARPVDGVGEEVQDRPVVPDGVLPRRPPGQYVGCKAGDHVRTRAEAPAGECQRRFREIHHGDIGVPGVEQSSGQARGACADVDERRVRTWPCERDRLQRLRWLFLGPTSVGVAVCVGGVPAGVEPDPVGPGPMTRASSHPSTLFHLHSRAVLRTHPPFSPCSSSRPPWSGRAPRWG